MSWVHDRQHPCSRGCLLKSSGHFWFCNYSSCTHVSTPHTSFVLRCKLNIRWRSIRATVVVQRRLGTQTGGVVERPAFILHQCRLSPSYRLFACSRVENPTGCRWRHHMYNRLNSSPIFVRHTGSCKLLIVDLRSHEKSANGQLPNTSRISGDCGLIEGLLNVSGGAALLHFLFYTNTSCLSCMRVCVSACMKGVEQDTSRLPLLPDDKFCRGVFKVFNQRESKSHLRLLSYVSLPSTLITWNENCRSHLNPSGAGPMGCPSMPGFPTPCS